MQLLVQKLHICKEIGELQDLAWMLIFFKKIGLSFYR